MHRRSQDVAIVGGGAVGVCAALELARQGARVVLLERGDTIPGGCSLGNAGVLRPSNAAPLANRVALRQALQWMWRPDSPFYVRPVPRNLPWLIRFACACREERERRSATIIRALNTASIALHAAYGAQGIDTGFRASGVLDVFERDDEFERARRAAKDRATVLDARAVHDFAPGLAPGIAGGILWAEDAYCDPVRFGQSIGRAASAAGADIRTGTAVTRLAREGAGAWRIETPSETLTAAIVVLAAGAWSPGIARALRLHLPVAAAKGYHVDVPPIAAQPALPIFLKESRVMATPLDGLLRLAGTLELAGLDLSIDAVRTRAIVGAGRRGFAGLDPTRILDLWAGFRPCSPDGLPIIGNPRALPGLICATGHGMLGMQVAPLTGQLVAELAVGKPTSHAIEALSPDRFHGIV